MIEIQVKLSGYWSDRWITKKVGKDSIILGNLCSNPACNKMVSAKGRRARKSGNHYCCTKCHGEHNRKI